MTNLEFVEAEMQDESYYGNICDLPRVTATLPCYKGRVQGKPALVLIDMGATVNLVNCAFIKDQWDAKGLEDTTTIYLADGMTRRECPIHKELEVEFSPLATTVQATEMDLRHFDAILGIPWLLKAQPKFD